jgi:hypothetical protein
VLAEKAGFSPHHVRGVLSLENGLTECRVDGGAKQMVVCLFEPNFARSS